MFTKIKTFIKKYLAIIAGFAFALAFWLLDILIDSYLFKEGELLQQFFKPEPMEIYFRVMVGSLFVIFGVCSHIITIRRKDIENELKYISSVNKSQARYSLLFSNMLNGFAYYQLITDELNNPVDFVLLEANPAYFKITGLNPPDLVGQKASQTTPWILKAAIDWLDIYGRAALKGEETKMEVYSKHLGKWLFISVYSPERGYFGTIVEDISERKIIEGVNRENQERMDVLFNSIQVGIVMVDRGSHTIAYVNQMAAKMIGASHSEIIDQLCHKFICPADIGACPITDKGQKVDNSERILLTADGRQIPILKTVVETELEGRPVLVESFVDITEQNKARQETEDIRRRMELILNGVGEGIYGLDNEKKTVFINPAAAEMLGYSSEELIGKLQHAITHHKKPDGSPYPVQECPIHASFQDGRVHHVTGEMFWRKDGSGFPVEYTCTPIMENGQANGSVVVFRDITERKQSEALQAAIYKISEISTSADNLLELYAGIHMVVDEMMNTANFYIALYNKKEELLEFPYFVDERDASPVSRPLKKGLTEYVLRTRKPLLAPPIVQKKMVATGEIEIVGTPSVDWMGFPLNIGKTILGVLVVQSYRKEVRFGARELSMLNFISDNIAATIQRKKSEDERKKLVKELQESLKNIKTLKGLVPICSSCKNIRNDKGYWQQVEVYVAEHTEADFSHGICDECAHKLYPNYVKKKNKTQGEEVG